MRVDLTTGGAGQTEGAGSSHSARSGSAASNSTSAASAANEPASGSAGADRAQFSYDQTRIRSLTEQALSAPEIRQAKVSSLAQSIGSGQYSVDAGKVASAIAAAAYRSGAL